MTPLQLVIDGALAAAELLAMLFASPAPVPEPVAIEAPVALERPAPQARGRE